MLCFFETITCHLQSQVLIANQRRDPMKATNLESQVNQASLVNPANPVNRVNLANPVNLVNPVNPKNLEKVNYRKEARYR